MQVHDLKGRLSEVKRDTDLLRTILLHIEDDPKMDGRRYFGFARPEDLDISGYSEDEFVYHMRLLISQGFLNGNGDTLPLSVAGLTWEGHEFLDNIRNDSVWSSTKKRVGDLVGSVSISVIAAVAEAEMKKLIGLK
jgi:hypothetical protein